MGVRTIALGVWLLWSVWAMLIMPSQARGSELTIGTGFMQETNDILYDTQMPQDTSVIGYQAQVTGKLYWGAQHTSLTAYTDRDSGENIIHITYLLDVYKVLEFGVSAGYLVQSLDGNRKWQRPVGMVTWGHSLTKNWYYRFAQVWGFKGKGYKTSYVGLEYRFKLTE